MSSVSRHAILDFSFIHTILRCILIKLFLVHSIICSYFQVKLSRLALDSEEAQLTPHNNDRLLDHKCSRELDSICILHHGF